LEIVTVQPEGGSPVLSTVYFIEKLKEIFHPFGNLKNHVSRPKGIDLK
jgi:hypothetical protein